MLTLFVYLVDGDHDKGRDHVEADGEDDGLALIEAQLVDCGHVWIAGRMF